MGILSRLFPPTQAAVLAAFVAFSAASAAEPEALVRTAQTPRVSATLAPELKVAVPGTEVPIVLHQRIADGWHTYWENPGDSGERIAIDWTLPDGVTTGELQYPTPEAIAPDAKVASERTVCGTRSRTSS